LLTPALPLDLDALERNIARMERAFDGYPATHRPHVKAHKCPRSPAFSWRPTRPASPATLGPYDLVQASTAVDEASG